MCSTQILWDNYLIKKIRIIKEKERRSLREPQNIYQYTLIRIEINIHLFSKNFGT